MDAAKTRETLCCVTVQAPGRQNMVVAASITSQYAKGLVRAIRRSIKGAAVEIIFETPEASRPRALPGWCGNGG
jgi:hypothetical protein